MFPKTQSPSLSNKKPSRKKRKIHQIYKFFKCPINFRRFFFSYLFLLSLFHCYTSCTLIHVLDSDMNWTELDIFSCLSNRFAAIHLYKHEISLFFLQIAYPQGREHKISTFAFLFSVKFSCSIFFCFFHWVYWKCEKSLFLHFQFFTVQISQN